MGSKETRYKEEQIIRILKEIEGGVSIAEVCRKYGVSEQKVYRWRSKYGGLDTSELQRLRELEAENSRLKKTVAQQVLDIDALKDLVAKKPNQVLILTPQISG
ncbi:MAG: transposase [Aggregatilineales bacterium]